MKYKLLLLLILLIPLAQAADTDKAMSWLSSQPKPTISSLAFSILAADAFKPSLSSDLKTELNSRKSTENCYPKGACSIKDTSLALLSLKQSPSSNTWLMDQQQTDKEGKWILQIETDNIGTCTINYLGKSVQINVNQGRISSSSCSTPTTLFDLNTCLESNLISSKEEIEFSIVCSNLASPVISAVYSLGNTYLPVGETTPALSKIIKIKNSYFKTFEDTLYTNWAFKESSLEPPSLIWLKKMYNSDSIIQNALLYILTEDKSFIQQLLTKQGQSGNFGSLYETALATHALRKANEAAASSLAITWLDSQQSPDGSWAYSIEDTAAILFYAYAPVSGAVVPTPPLSPKTAEACKENALCEIEWGETAANCPADCRCGDNLCDSSESFTTCPADCKAVLPITPAEEEAEEEGRGFFFWFIIFLLILLIIALAYFYYTKFYKKGRSLIAELKGIFSKSKEISKEAPKTFVTTTPIRRPVTYPIRVTAKTKLEEQLAKSLEEAKKVLKK